MRKWCAGVAMCALMTLPAFAQQKAADDTTKANETVATADSGDSNAVYNVADKAWALPAVPKATPFPDTKPVVDTRPVGTLVPRYEVGFGFSYISFNPGDGFRSFNNLGGWGEFTFNPYRYLGLAIQVDGYDFDRRVPTFDPTTGAINGSTTVDGGLTTLLAGPRLNMRKFNHFVPFAEFLIGAARAGNPVTGLGNQWTFAAALGGGIDAVLWKHVAWRVAELDYFQTNFNGPYLNAKGRQDSFRAQTGLILRFGIPPPPPPPNKPPVATCSASPTSVYAGSNDAIAIHVNASDPDNDTLTYSYSATGGAVDGTGADARWNSSGVAVGTYTVNAKVDDGRGGTATCSADVSVAQKPNQPPTISCSVERSPIMPGERTKIVANASDPDNDPLTYSWTATGGQVVGTGSTVDFDSTGLAAGSYTVKGTVSDGRGGTADCSANVDVQQPPPPPQATKVGDCGYTKFAASRFDNACKRVGDDVALRLKNEPTAKLVIVGYADAKEPKAAKLAQTRADLAKKYLVEKGIDASRISTRVGEASKEKGQEKANRRVDFIFVPEGATY